MKKEQLVKEIREFLEKQVPVLESDKSAWAWYTLPEESELPYLVLLEWQEGYDENDNERFIQEGYELTVSVRVDTDQYFKCDNPYPICTEYGDVIDGLTMYENFQEIAEDLYDLFQQAKECESTSMKFLGYNV